MAQKDLEEFQRRVAGAAEYRDLYHHLSSTDFSPLCLISTLRTRKKERSVTHSVGGVPSVQ